MKVRTQQAEVGGSLWTEGYPIKYPLQWFCGQNPHMGVLETFSTGTYAIIGTTCFEFENVMKSTTKKKKKLMHNYLS